LVRNNQFDQAQITTNPSTILGYMNTRHQGPEGSLFATGDTHDVYQVSALGGEIINLTINAAEEADLDLYVYDMNGQIVSSSVGVDLYCRFKALYGFLILSNRAQRDPKDIEESDGFRKYRNDGYQYIDNGHKLIVRVHVDERFN
ncbi:MAG TPA: hypothetical protein DD440_05240, partial [Porticoccaceae bacterium]|nr:hypothetical protein [Porticoccaceae bacterium]